MTTRIISLHDFDDDDPLPPPTPLPLHGRPLPPHPETLGGVLVFDDGSIIVVSDTTVVGRDPVADPRVASGQIHGAAITGADLVVSRAHAELRVLRSHVEVRDMRSTNGSLLQRCGSNTWQLLEPDTPVMLGRGDHLSFGGLICRFDMLHEAPPS